MVLWYMQTLVVNGTRCRQVVSSSWMLQKDVSEIAKSLPGKVEEWVYFEQDVWNAPAPFDAVLYINDSRFLPAVEALQLKQEGICSKIMRNFIRHTCQMDQLTFSHTELWLS